MGQSCQEFHFQEVERHCHCLLLQSSRANVYVETLLEDFWKNHTKYEIKTIKKLNKNDRKKAESLFTLQSSRANGYVETLRVFWKNQKIAFHYLTKLLFEIKASEMLVAPRMSECFGLGLL